MTGRDETGGNDEAGAPDDGGATGGGAADDGDAVGTGDSDGPAGDGGAAGAGDPAGERVRRERSFRGISRRLAVRYLANLGGDPVGDDDARVTGDGWEATLSEDTAGVGPSLTLTEVTVTFEGDPQTLDELIPKFAQKAMRAGG